MSSAEGNNQNQSEYSTGLQALNNSFKALFIVLTILVVGVIVYLLTFGSFYTVSTKENIIHLRFGKVINVHSEGYHWKLKLTDEIISIPTDQQLMNIKTFWDSQLDEKADGEQGFSGKSSLNPGQPDNNYLITGDENIIHSNWSILYRITNPRAYYQNLVVPSNPSGKDEEVALNGMRGGRGPKTMIKLMCENALINYASQLEIGTSIIVKSSDVKKELQQIIKNCGIDLGITIDSVKLGASSNNKQPVSDNHNGEESSRKSGSISAPAAVKMAFDDVQNAANKLSSLKNEALAYKVKVENATESQVSRIISESETYYTKTVSDLRAASIYFESILEEYNKHPDSALITLYNTAVGNALKKATAKYVYRVKSDGKQELRFKINRPPVPTKAKE